MSSQTLEQKNVKAQVFVTCDHEFCNALVDRFYGTPEYKGASIVHKDLSFEGEGTVLNFETSPDKLKSIFDIVVSESCVKKARLFEILKQ